MLYMPVIQGIRTPADNPRGLQSPADQGMPFTEHYIPVPGSDGLLIHGWFIPAEEHDFCPSYRFVFSFFRLSPSSRILFFSSLFLMGGKLCHCSNCSILSRECGQHRPSSRRISSCPAPSQGISCPCTTSKSIGTIFSTSQNDSVSYLLPGEPICL